MNKPLHSKAQCELLDFLSREKPYFRQMSANYFLYIHKVIMRKF